VLYRLGLSYSFDKKYPEAIEALDRAEGLGGVKLAGPKPRDLVTEARAMAVKAQEAAAATAVPAPPEPEKTESAPQSNPVQSATAP